MRRGLDGFVIVAIAVCFGIAMGKTMQTPAAAEHEPCVAYLNMPNIPGYESGLIDETVVFMDAPVFDVVFKGCENENRAILAATPDNLIRVMRKEDTRR